MEAQTRCSRGVGWGARKLMIIDKLKEEKRFPVSFQKCLQDQAEVWNSKYRWLNSES